MKVFDKKHSRIKYGCKVVWKDLVCINGEVFAEEHQIDNDVDIDPDDKQPIFRLDRFFEAVAAKYNCNTDDIRLWTMEGESFAEDANLPDDFYQTQVPFGAESCGAYIDGIPAEDLL